MDTQTATSQIDEPDYTPVIQDGKIVRAPSSLIIAFEQFMTDHKIINTEEELTNSRVAINNLAGAISITDPDEYDLFLKLYRKIYQYEPEYEGLNMNEMQGEVGPLLLDFDLNFPVDEEKFTIRQYNDQTIESIVEQLTEILGYYFPKRTHKFDIFLFEKKSPTIVRNEKGKVIKNKDGFHLCIFEPFDRKIRYTIRHQLVSNELVNTFFHNLKCTNSIEDIIDESTIERNGWMMYGARKFTDKTEPKKGSSPYLLTAQYHGSVKLEKLTISTDEYVNFFSIRRFRDMEPIQYNEDVPFPKIPEAPIKKSHQTVKHNQEGINLGRVFLQNDAEDKLKEKPVGYEVKTKTQDCLIIRMKKTLSPEEKVELFSINFINFLVCEVEGNDNLTALASNYSTWKECAEKLSLIEHFCQNSLYPLFELFSSYTTKSNYNAVDCRRLYGDLLSYTDDKLNRNPTVNSLDYAVNIFKRWIEKKNTNKIVADAIKTQYRKYRTNTKVGRSRDHVVRTPEEIQNTPQIPTNALFVRNDELDAEAVEADIQSIQSAGDNSSQDMTILADDEANSVEQTDGNSPIDSATEFDSVQSFSAQNGDLQNARIESYFNDDFVTYFESGEANKRNQFIVRLSYLLTSVFKGRTDDDGNIEMTDNDLAQIIFSMFHNYYRVSSKVAGGKKMGWVFFNGIWVDDIDKIITYTNRYIYEPIDAQLKNLTGGDQVETNIKSWEVQIAKLRKMIREQTRNIKLLEDQRKKILTDRMKIYNEIIKLEKVFPLPEETKEAAKIMKDQMHEIEKDYGLIDNKINFERSSLNDLILELDEANKKLSLLQTKKIGVIGHIFNDTNVLSYLRRKFGNVGMRKSIISALYDLSMEKVPSQRVIVENPERIFDTNTMIWNFLDCSMELTQSGPVCGPHKPSDMLTIKTSKKCPPLGDTVPWLQFNGEKEPSRLHTAVNEKAVEEVEEYFRRVLPDDDVREYFLGVLSWSMNGNISSNKFFILNGKGRNGKSVMCELLKNAFDVYYGDLAESFLTEKDSGSNNASPALMTIKGKRLVVQQEIQQGIPLNEARFKRITGGDTLTGRHLYQNQETFKPQCTFMMCCNSLPTISTDPAMWRRIVIINFPSKFTTEPRVNNKYEHAIDPNISKRVNSDRWRDALLYMLLVKYYDKGVELAKNNLNPPNSIQTYTMHQRQELNSLLSFVLKFFVVMDKDATLYKESQKRFAEDTAGKTEEEIADLTEERSVNIGLFIDVYRAWFRKEHNGFPDPYGTISADKIEEDCGINIDVKTQTLYKVYLKTNKYLPNSPEIGQLRGDQAVRKTIARG